MPPRQTDRGTQCVLVSFHGDIIVVRWLFDVFAISFSLVVTKEHLQEVRNRTNTLISP